MRANTRRIESKISRTAEMTCASRAMSYFEKKPQYKSDDYIAPVLVPKYLLPFLRSGLFRRFYRNKISPRGIYEYVIARTKYVDDVFRNAIKNEFDQVLIFGAGFDSRGMRLMNESCKTRVYELDVPVTQNAKINQLKKRKIRINSNIIFIPIDFNNESLSEKLAGSGFDRNKKSLFILEGLLMYLSPEAVRSTFEIIKEFAGTGSEIVFDYIFTSVLRRENLYYGEKEIIDIVWRANEMWTFGIEKGEVKSFLRNYHFTLIEDNHSEDLEYRYFRDEDGNIAGRINGTHGIAYAKKVIEAGE